MTTFGTWNIYYFSLSKNFKCMTFTAFIKVRNLSTASTNAGGNHQEGKGIIAVWIWECLGLIKKKLIWINVQDSEHEGAE